MKYKMSWSCSESFPGGSDSKESNLPATWDTQVCSLGQEDPLENGNVNPLQYSCLGNPTDRGARQATVHGVVQSQTWLSNWARTQHMTEVILSMGSQRGRHNWATEVNWTEGSSVHVEITFESESAGAHFSHLCVRWPASQNLITNCKIRMTWNLLWPVS